MSCVCNLVDLGLHDLNLVLDLSYVHRQLVHVLQEGEVASLSLVEHADQVLDVLNLCRLLDIFKRFLHLGQHLVRVDLLPSRGG